MNHVGELTPSQQRYLATILSLESEKGRVKQSDIAEKVKVNRSSVTSALRALAERTLIEYEPYEAVTLTPIGKEMAEAISARGRIIKAYLTQVLNIEEHIAQEAAFDMQHTIPDVVIERLTSEPTVGPATSTQRETTFETTERTEQLDGQ